MASVEGTTSFRTWSGKAREVIAWWWALPALSFLLSSLIPLYGTSPYGDLSGLTDHIRHSQSTWSFLHKGFEVYTKTHGAMFERVAFKQGIHSWDHVGVVYPPGVFAVFLVPALLGGWVTLSQPAFGAACILHLLAVAHLSLVAVFRTLANIRPGGRVVLGFVFWSMFLRMTLEGFYDAAWIGCGSLMVLALTRRQHARALLFFSAAALLHYRAVILVPLGMYALYGALYGRPVRTWPWLTLGVAALSSAVVVWTFILMYPQTAAHRVGQPPLSSFFGTGLFFAIMTFSLLAAVVAIRVRDVILLASIALTTVFAVLDLQGFRGYSQHAALMLVIPLLVGLQTPRGEVGRTRQMIIVWMVCLQSIVWTSWPAQTFNFMVDRFHPNWHATVFAR